MRRAPFGGRLGAASRGASWGALVLVGALACSSSTDDPSSGNDGGSGTSGSRSCKVAPGELPAVDCTDAAGSCNRGGCPRLDEARCGSASTCLPMADNRGKDVLDFRMRRLTLSAPPRLAETLLQNIVVTNNVELSESTCAEQGTGTFTWLLRVDKTRSVLTAGGAPPSADPFGQGYCFAKTTVGSDRGGSTTLAPAEATIRIEADAAGGDRVELTSPLRKLNVPIFVRGDVANAIVLPLRDVMMRDVRLGDGGNCIGRFVRGALDGECQEAPSLCSKWQAGGVLGGYVLLEDADRIVLVDQDRTLCALLTGATARSCPRDAAGALTVKGDYCSQTAKPGDCGDAYWLAATFSAAAVRIYDGAGNPTCGG